MRKTMRIFILLVGLVLFPLRDVQGLEVYSKNEQVYRASQYKIFENTMVISLKDGKSHKLLLQEVDWDKTLGDENVFQLVDTDFVYIRNGTKIESKGYIVRYDEIIEIITQDNKILKYERSDIDFEKIAEHLIKKKLKQQEEPVEEEPEAMVNASPPAPITGEEVSCNANILIPSPENPLIQFKFNVITQKDTRLDNLFLNVITIKAAAKNLSDTVGNLSYEDFTLVTDEGVRVKPDSSSDNTFSIDRLAKNAMTFGIIRFSFTTNYSTRFAKYLIYEGSYGKFACLLQ